ncbi:TetR/AcrR family transcriptional regulator [Hoeflea sp. G2-23]|uniref:TetR/AcrR family transcriptional regulator n=1 Tax=Hoeflea algicola TaxID=2983763 RepID=A0ABT3Z454_9HYPH|nr:TetR/AcrR family transcriptional regulator [Hoeflea algicola]MCY0146433.1 TetR/AcrR family transcriptional regulator [Hoeflea algicola]
MKRARPYNREVALDAAVNLFWTKGYHATSLKDLEAALQMKPGSIYAAFSSKQALYLEALERYFEKSRNGFRQEIESVASPLDGLSDYLVQLARTRSQEPQGQACMLVRTLLDTTSTDAVIAEKANAYLEQIQTEFAAAFDRAREIGEIATDADSKRLARRYQASINALRIELHRGVDQAEITALAQDMVGELERLRVPPAAVEREALA